MRKYPTDHWLWVAISGTSFLALLALWVASENLNRDGFRRITNDVLYLAIACGVFGWVVQAVAVICGVRLSDRPPPEEAGDYDDAPPAPPIP